MAEEVVAENVIVEKKEEEFIPVISEEIKDPILVQYVKDRVMHHNKNFVILFVGPTGCLSGDTKLKINKAGNSRETTIEKLWERFSGNYNNKNKKIFDKSIISKIRSFDGEIIKLNRIKDVTFSGMKEVFLLELENGLSIKATANHKIMTKRGWVELQHLRCDDEVMCDTPNAIKSNRKRIKLRDIGLCVGKNHPYNIQPNGQISIHNLIYESRMNELSFTNYLDILLNESEKCKNLKFIDPSKHTIHHKDGCHYNNSIENLELLPRIEHYSKHNLYTNFSQGLPKFSKVSSTSKLGTEKTYDIECEEPYHNFVANGMVVHNSGKSYSALRFCEQMDPTFSIDRCCFKAKDFMATINSLVERSEQGESIVGKVILWDEMGVEHNAREFMSISNRVLNYFFQTSRHLNLIVVMTVPLLSFIDSSTRKLMHCVAEMAGINSHDKTTVVKVKMIQTNVMTGKEYPKYLRYRKNGKSYVAKKLRFKLPSRELVKLYERKKKSFTTTLNKEIMNRLIKVEEKEAIANKPRHMTEVQETTARLLLKHSADEVAKMLDVNPGTVYKNMTGMERRGYIIRPVRDNLRVVRYNIVGFVDDLANSPEDAHND